MKLPLQSWGFLSSGSPTHSIGGSPASLPASGGVLAFGLGKSYGDCAFNSLGTALLTASSTRILSFEPQWATITVEAGLTLSELVAFLVPHGFFLPVVPGTLQITVGGAIANDIHGKNHHLVGSFGHHVLSLELLRSAEGLVRCSPTSNASLFAATIGGMGLTGLITTATLALQRIVSPLVEVQQQRFGALADFESLSTAADTGGFTHTVAWVDALAPSTQLGRGVFMAGRWSSTPARLTAHSSRTLTIARLPFSLLIPPALKAFNTLYYTKAPARPTQRTVGYAPFFCPLDGLANWKHLYGPLGLCQFQAVVPLEQFGAIAELLRATQKSGQGSFLGVLKKMGSLPNVGLMSFARPGYTLALDFAMRGPSTWALLRTLAQITAEAGGRFYSAKDCGYQTPAMFRAGYPQATEFAKFIDPRFNSDLWQRLYT